MAKGGRSKRWTRTQGSDRSTVTQNSKNGTTWSFSNGSGNSRTTVSHRPDGRIVRTTTVRHGDGYTSRTSTVSGKKERQKSYSSPLRRTRGNSSDGLGLGDAIIGLFTIGEMVSYERMVLVRSFHMSGIYGYWNIIVRTF